MKQIAHNMGISIPATKSRLARAKVALRKTMVSTSDRARRRELSFAGGTQWKGEKSNDI